MASGSQINAAKLSWIYSISAIILWETEWQTSSNEWNHEWMLYVLVASCSFSHCYGVQQEPTAIPLALGQCCQQQQGGDEEHDDGSCGGLRYWS
jgi:hypothetical protein